LTDSLTNSIRSKARELGFQKTGIAQAGELKREADRLSEWLGRGYHATMAWMEKRVNERQDIVDYFPEAKSIVCVGMNYFHGQASGGLKISNYAWGDDYHSVVKERLKELLAHVQELKPETKGVVCADTSPVMEKPWAQRAGLGWIGKHTNLISKDYGSWLFLGELILDRELEYDPPFAEDLCGTCTACIDACPTDAIVEEYVLDSSRCISYLTIEHRGDLPEEMADQLHGWIYGCDICQEVCPWNVKFARKSSEDSFAPRCEVVERKEAEWMAMTEDNYGRTFRKSAVKRTKFVGLKRNISACSQK
jgi:epoxyqueuosine reductase